MNGLIRGVWYSLAIFLFGIGNAYSAEKNITPIYHLLFSPNKFAPSAFQATLLPGGKIVRLTWQDNATDEEGFKLLVTCRFPSGIIRRSDFQFSADTERYDLDLVSNNMVPELPRTDYFFILYAYNDKKSAGPEPLEFKIPDPSIPKPSPPTSLNVTSALQSSTELVLTWTDVSDNEQGFRIYRSTAGSGIYIEVGEVGENETSFRNRSLSPCTDYEYRVFSFNAPGESAGYAQAEGKTAPTPPSSLSASQGNAAMHAIFLNWSDDSCDANAKYHVHELSAEDGDYKRLTPADDPIDATSSDIIGVPAMIYHFYKISSVDSSGREGNLSEYSVGWAPSPVPLNVWASRGEYPDRIRLSWDVVQLYWNWPGWSTASYATDYDIWYSTSINGTYEKFFTVNQNENDSSDPFVYFYDSTPNLPDVSTGTHLYFKVTTVYYDDFDVDPTTDEFESEPSAPAEGWTSIQSPTYLPGPAWLNATDGDLCKITVSWASVPGAVSYNVYRSPSPLAPTWTLKYNVPGTSVTELVTSNLNVIQFSSYYYVVVPVDSIGVEGFSSPSDGGYASSPGPTGCY